MMRASQGGVFSSLSYSRKRRGYEAKLDMNVNGEKTRRETAGLSRRFRKKLAIIMLVIVGV